MDDNGIQSNGFVKEAAGPEGVFAVFEDDGETGYLYVYEPGGKEISRHLHIYDRSPRLLIEDRDVQVLWSTDGSKCGVLIWNKMRGIIDLVSGKEGRVWLEDRDTPGVADAEWLEGFSAQ